MVVRAGGGLFILFSSSAWQGRPAVCGRGWACELQWKIYVGLTRALAPRGGPGNAAPANATQNSPHVPPCFRCGHTHPNVPGTYVYIYIYTHMQKQSVCTYACLAQEVPIHRQRETFPGSPRGAPRRRHASGKHFRGLPEVRPVGGTSPDVAITGVSPRCPRYGQEALC